MKVSLSERSSGSVLKDDDDDDGDDDDNYDDDDVYMISACRIIQAAF